jgi:hypothetical protein
VLAASLAQATNQSMGALHHLTKRQRSWSAVGADGVLALFAMALPHLAAGVRPTVRQSDSTPMTPRPHSVFVRACWLCSVLGCNLSVIKGV